MKPAQIGILTIAFAFAGCEQPSAPVTPTENEHAATPQPIATTGPSTPAPTLANFTAPADSVQTALTEVASVPFGASREQTVELLGKRFGMQTSIQKPSELSFTGGEFAGMVVSRWWYRFATNKLYEIHLTFDTNEPFITFEGVARLLAQKYGPPNSTDRSYDFPYNVPFRTLDDSKIKEAFKAGKAHFYSLWRLTNGTIDCVLSPSGGGDVRLYLTYTHSELAKNRSEETKSDL